MFNKLCPVMMSVLAFLTFSDTQSMNKRQGITSEAEARLQRFDLRNAEDHGKKLYDLHFELKEQDTKRSYEASLNKLEKRLEKQRNRNVQLGLHVSEFNGVLAELDTLELQWINREYTYLCINELEEIRAKVLKDLTNGMAVNLQRNTEETEFYKDKFMAVLAELKKHDNSEEEVWQDFHAWFEEEYACKQAEKAEAVVQEVAKEEQLGESSVGLGEFFANEFASTQEGQEAAFAQLAQSIVSLEQSIQDVPELFGEAEKAVESVKDEPVKVGILTKLSDWWYGPSNLVSELSSEKISLDTLKKSPDMQSRINYMIARHSLTPKTDMSTLSALVGIYTALDTLNFKFVDAEVNIALFNACKTRLAEEEKKYTDTRAARILAIAKYLTAELDKMVAEEAPHVETIVKLEELECLIGKVGMVELNEQKVVHTLEPEMFEIIGGIEKVSQALIEAKEATKEEAAK